jgi:hypothetical protein
MVRAENPSTRSRYAVATPRKVVKPSGTPNSLIAIWLPPFLARIASSPLFPRETRVRSLRTGQDHFGWAWRSCGGRRQVHLDTLVPDKLHTGAPVLSAAPISRSRSGAEPTTSGWSSTLAWRGFWVVLPCHWHCSRSGQGRQLRMLAPYTTRRLPSASRRCSCGISFWSAGHRSVPSGWRGKSVPVKRPVFQDVAVVGGPYPEAGTDEAGRVAACSGCDGKGRSKLGDAHGRWFQLMPQFQPEVPYPTSTPSANIPVPRPSGCTTDRDLARCLRLPMSAQRRRDAGTTRAHRKR